METLTLTKSSSKPKSMFQVPSVDREKGVLTAYDERFLFIPIKLIHSIEDRLAQSFGPVTATSIQYEIGKEGGGQYLDLAGKAGFQVKSIKDIQRIAENLGTLSGWGKLQVVDFDFGKRLARIRWTNGVSVRNKKGKTPVCHFGRGVLTGAVQAIMKSPCESIELSCQGKGDKYCEAVIGDPREIERIADEPVR